MSRPLGIQIRQAVKAPSAERPWRVIGADGYTYYVTAASEGAAVRRAIRQSRGPWQGVAEVHDDGAP